METWSELLCIKCHAVGYTLGPGRD